MLVIALTHMFFDRGSRRNSRGVVFVNADLSWGAFKFGGRRWTSTFRICTSPPGTWGNSKQQRWRVNTERGLLQFKIPGFLSWWHLEDGFELHIFICSGIVFINISTSRYKLGDTKAESPSALGEMKIALSIYGFAFLNRPKVRRERFPPLLLPPYLTRQHSGLFWRFLTLGMLLDHVLRCRPAAVLPQAATWSRLKVWAAPAAVSNPVKYPLDFSSRTIHCCIATCVCGGYHRLEHRPWLP